MRIAIIGTTGSEKTVLAHRLAHALDLHHIELDALYWGPDSQERPPEEFRSKVDVQTQNQRWVTDGNYQMVSDLVWERATHLIWLNYSFPLVMWRLVSRTLFRAVARAPVFSGNRESLSMAFSRDSILLWGLTTHGPNRKRYRLVFDGNTYDDVKKIELRRPRDERSLMGMLQQG